MTTASLLVPPDAEDERHARVRLFGRLLASHGALFMLVAVLVAAVILRPHFFDELVLRNTTRMAAVLGVIVIGQILLLIVGCVDLSVAAVVGFAAVLVTEAGPPFPLGILIAAAIAVAVGLVNGWLVTRRHVPPFVATFGMLVLLEGARFAYTRGSTSGRVADSLVDFVMRPLGPITVPLVLWVLLSIAAAIFIARTVTGRRMVMTGSNEEMGRLSGLAVDRYKMGAFVACSLLAVLSGLLLAGSTSYVDQWFGRNSELDSVTAALLGGARFSGGEGSFVGGAVGALLLASVFTLIVLLGWPPELQLVAKGFVLIVALGSQGLLRRDD